MRRPRMLAQRCSATHPASSPRSLLGPLIPRPYSPTNPFAATTTCPHPDGLARLTCTGGLDLDLRDAYRLGALGTGLLLIGDLRALGQRAVAIAVDTGEMD